MRGNKHLLTGIMLLAVLCCSAQDYFEGMIVYKYTYKSLTKDIGTDVFTKALSSSLIVYFKEDKFVMISSATTMHPKITLTVHLNEGVMYKEYDGNDTIVKTHFKNAEETLLSLQRNAVPNKDVLGQNCESVTIESQMLDAELPYKTSKSTYYFSTNYKLNPECFRDFKEGFMNLYVAEAGAVSLLTEIELKGFLKITQQAQTITVRKIPDTMFNVKPFKTVVEE